MIKNTVGNSLWAFHQELGKLGPFEPFKQKKKKNQAWNQNNWKGRFLSHPYESKNKATQTYHFNPRLSHTHTHTHTHTHYTSHDMTKI